ncbi:MAG: hypothetical protein IJ229_02160 [Clostridia bacterium]|nr:hypothetical protein [Clostridia bacterium]MBR1683860.1 hypothetical protein [Clostridia bacterium]
MIIVGQIRAALEKRMESVFWGGEDLSVMACLTKAARIKMVRSEDATWRLAMGSPEQMELLRQMSVDI